MGVIEDHKKFKRTTEQKNPLNPDGINKEDINQYDISKTTKKHNTSKK